MEGAGRLHRLHRLLRRHVDLNSSNSRHVRFVSPYVIFHFGSTTHIPAYSKDIIWSFLIPCECIGPNNLCFEASGPASLISEMTPFYYHSVTVGRETKRVRLGPIAFIYYILRDHDTYIPA